MSPLFDPALRTAPTLTVTICREDVEASQNEGGIRWITARTEGGQVRFWADEETMRAIAGRVSSWGTSTIPIPLHHVEGAV